MQNPAQNPVVLDATREVIDRLFVMVRNAASHAADDPAMSRSAIAVAEALTASNPPFALQFVGDGIFRDKNLVPLDFEHFVRARELADALDARGIHEVAFDRVLNEEEILALSRALVTDSGPREINTPSVDGVRCRAIPNAREGSEMRWGDPAMAAATQISLAIAGAETLVSGGGGLGGGPWSVQAGLSVVRRLEQAITQHRAMALQTLEAAPGAWNIARYGVSGSYLVLATLDALGISRGTRRAAAHATLGVILEGLREYQGVAPSQAAASFAERIISAPAEAASGMSPHRLQTTTIAHFLTLGAGPAVKRLRVARLVELVYRLECLRRVNPRSPRSLSEVIAEATASQSRYDEAWMLMLTTCLRQMIEGETTSHGVQGQQ